MRNASVSLLAIFFFGCGLATAMAQSQIPAIKIDPAQKKVIDTPGDLTVDVAVNENTTGKDRESSILFKLPQGTSTTSMNFQQVQTKGYELTGTLVPEAKHIGWQYNAIHSDWLRNIGFDYTEHPHCNGIGGHMDGVHLVVVNDTVLKQPVLRFDIHITPIIDGDRCSGTDRQRNELKTSTNNTTWAKMQGNWDEWQRLEWKMKIPKGYQPTPNFCHIHQIKAQDGPNNGSPVITITLRADRSGSNKQVTVEHNSSGGSGRSLGSMARVPMEEFEDEWVQIVEEMHFRHDGSYSIKITRIRDGKELLAVSKDNIDLWRRGATFLRSKYGIYRSLAGGNLRNNPVGQSPLLKNESLFMTDFKIYEKNTNPNPTMRQEASNNAK